MFLIMDIACVNDFHWIITANCAECTNNIFMNSTMYIYDSGAFIKYHIYYIDFHRWPCHANEMAEEIALQRSDHPNLIYSRDSR